MAREPSDTCIDPEVEAVPRPTVLLVEDEVLIRIDIADQLRARGLTVLEAVDADEALSVLGSGARVDVVLSDIQMPGSMDGLQLVRVIRSRHRHVKVIVCSGHIISGHDLPEDVEVDAFFAKPYSCIEVEQRIRQLLEQTK